jgi:S-adenosylmethionine/arginine decarboxylase-like enzyme
MPFHLTADLLDIPEPVLRDLQLLRAALVAAAGAVGLGPLTMPTVHEGPHALALTLVSDGRHIIVHALPGAGVLLLDVLAPAVQDSQRALDVFTRRLTPGDVRSDTRERPPHHHARG